jgi:hypothetical protein
MRQHFFFDLSSCIVATVMTRVRNTQVYGYSSFFIWITTQYTKRHSELKPERKSIFIDAVLSYDE